MQKNFLKGPSKLYKTAGIVLLFLLFVSIAYSREIQTIDELNQRLESSYDKYKIKLAIVENNEGVDSFKNTAFQIGLVYNLETNELGRWYRGKGLDKVIHEELPQMNSKQLKLYPLASFQNFVDILDPSGAKARTSGGSWVHNPDNIIIGFEGGGFASDDNEFFKYEEGEWKFRRHKIHKDGWISIKEETSKPPEENTLGSWHKKFGESSYEEGLMMLVVRAFQRDDDDAELSIYKYEKLIKKYGKKHYNRELRDLVWINEDVDHDEDIVFGFKGGIGRIKVFYMFDDEKGVWVVAKRYGGKEWTSIDTALTESGWDISSGERDFLKKLKEAKSFRGGLEELITRTNLEGGELVVYKGSSLFKKYNANEDGGSELINLVGLDDESNVFNMLEGSWLSGSVEGVSFAVKDGANVCYMYEKGWYARICDKGEWKRIHDIEIDYRKEWPHLLVKLPYLDDEQLSNVDAFFLEDLKSASYKEGLRNLIVRTIVNNEDVLWRNAVFVVYKGDDIFEKYSYSNERLVEFIKVV